MRNLYTKSDLREQLKLSIGTIDNHMKSGNLNYTKIGKAVRFSDDDVDSWLQKHDKKRYTIKKSKENIGVGERLQEMF
jgi:excisionase family DNA binding protein